MKAVVIDDDSTMLKSIEMILKQQNITTQAYQNGQLAIDDFQKNREVQIFFIDLMMPIIDGYETAKAIRKIENKLNPEEQIPLIGITASEEDYFNNSHQNRIFNELLFKPLKSEDVIDCLKRWKIS